MNYRLHFLRISVLHKWLRRLVEKKKENTEA